MSLGCDAHEIAPIWIFKKKSQRRMYCHVPTWSSCRGPKPPQSQHHHDLVLIDSSGICSITSSPFSHCTFISEDLDAVMSMSMASGERNTCTLSLLSMDRVRHLLRMFTYCALQFTTSTGSQGTIRNTRVFLQALNGNIS